METMTVTLLATILATSAFQQDISQLWQGNLKDAAFTARVVRGDQRELAKINRDFGQSYRFTSTTVKMKEPFKLRLEARVEDTDILFIVNGVRKYFRIPRANISRREDVSKAPGKRQTALDFGLLTPSLFNELYQAKFVRVDRATGQPVFDLTYVPSLKDKTRNRVWVDPQRRYIAKREWYSQIDGRLQATFVHDRPQQSSGVWFPTRLTVINADGKVAGITEYVNLKANVGLDDSLFAIK